MSSRRTFASVLSKEDRQMSTNSQRATGDFPGNPKLENAFELCYPKLRHRCRAERGRSRVPPLA